MFYHANWVLVCMLLFSRNYIAYAKTFQPYINQQLTDHITGVYAKIREDQEEVSRGLLVQVLLISNE